MKDDVIMWLIFGFVIIGAIVQNTKIDFQTAGNTIATVGIALMLIFFFSKKGR